MTNLKAEGDDQTRCVALVPLNTLTAAKSRLREVLAEGDRRALVIWLAGRVLVALRDSSVVERIAVVSPDPRMLALLESELGLQVGREPGVGPRSPSRGGRGVDTHLLVTDGGGLIADLEQGRHWAIERGANALMVVLADLPLLTPDALRRLHAEAQVERERHRHAVVLAPDRAGRGTNAMLLRPADALPFAFGEESLSRHLALARRARIAPSIFSSEETSLDVDTLADLQDVIDRGLWRPSGTQRKAAVS